MRALDHILGLLFPPKCLLCGGLLGKEELDLCRTCRQEAPRYPGGKRKLQFLDSFVAVWYYEGNARRSLLRYKFRGVRHYAPGYGRMVAMAVLQAHPEGFDLLTWVPISTLRRLGRGYDQGELLARYVGRELGLRPTPTLKKVRHNRAQSGLRSDADRRKNVRQVYRLRQDACLEGKRILLLDDILTTGATAGEAARVLRSGGAKEVHCAAIAAAGKE